MNLPVVNSNVDENKGLVLKPQPIFHAFPVNDTNGVHEEFVHNDTELSEDEFKEKLASYNSRGYNIYKTFNTFVSGKRDSKSVFEFRGILIDLDYTQEEKEDYISILSHCNRVRKKYGIFPIEINETFKGFHLIYGLSEDLMFINEDTYLELSKILVGEFNADYNAKQITGLYKVHGFIDHKEDVVSKKGRNFKIINKFSQPKSKHYEVSIQEEHLRRFNLLDANEKLSDFLRKELFGRRIYWNKMMKGLGTHEKAETFLSQHAGNMKQKALKKKRYDLLIESIDARVWIDDINDANEKGKPGFDKKIRIRKDGISLDDTGGLKLYFNKNIGRYQIKDFSTGTRYGNKKFLFNHYFGFSGLNKSQRKSKALSYVDFIAKYFGIHPNASLTKVAISEKIVHDFIKDKIHVDMDGIIEDVKKGIFDNGKVKFDENGISKCDWFRIYFLINSFIQINDINSDEMGNYELDYDEFFEFSGFSSGNFENKKYVNTILAYLNRIYLVHTYGKTQKIRYVAKNNVVGKKIFVCLDTENVKAGKTPKTKITYFPSSLGNFATKKTDNRRTKFLTEILYGISSFKSVKIKLGSDQNHGYGIPSAIRVLSQMRADKIIPDFLIRKNYAYIGEKKYLQSLGKRKTGKYRKKKLVKD